MTDALTTAEQAQLAELETTIGAGLREFQRTGAALAEIRDGRLYRATHASFDEYLAGRWHFSRQHAGRLIQAAEVAQILEPTGYTPENERQARELRPAAEGLRNLPTPAAAVAQKYIHGMTAGGKASTIEVNGVIEATETLVKHGLVEDPETGDHVAFVDLPPERQMAVLKENVSTATYERVKRQEQHIKDSRMNAQSNGRGGWTDWVTNYAGQSLTATQELRIVVKKDPSGNVKCQALVVDTESHQTVAFGDSADWLKKAVLNLAEEVKA